MTEQSARLRVVADGWMRRETREGGLISGEHGQMAHPEHSFTQLIHNPFMIHRLADRQTGTARDPCVREAILHQR